MMSKSPMMQAPPPYMPDPSGPAGQWVSKAAMEGASSSKAKGAAMSKAVSTEAAPMSKATFEVFIDHTSGERLGIDIFHEDGIVLLVTGITGGLVGAWNAAHPGQDIKMDDRIVEVNGVRGDSAKILEECKQHKPLRVTIERRSIDQACALRKR